MRFAAVWLVLLWGFGLAQACTPVSTHKGSVPIHGFGEAQLEPYDRVMLRLLERYRIPGGALAVGQQGRLVLAKGYGWADLGAKQPVQPDSRFRLASLSKPITAVALLYLGEGLVAAGKYTSLEAFLSQKAYALAGIPPLNTLRDPRIQQITLRDLLQHSGGWNRNIAGDWPFRPSLTYVAKTIHQPETLSPNTLLAFAFSRPLNYAPGTRHSYSNVGYLLLGRIIERLSGVSYGEYVQSMLYSFGTHSLALGSTPLQGRLSSEVHYYDHPGAPWISSILDGNQTPRPYGEFYLENLASAGGWVASAPDMVRFVAVLEGLRPDFPPALSPEALALMLARPRLKVFEKSPRYYALGWGVRLPQEQLEALRPKPQSSSARPKPVPPAAILARMNQLGYSGLEWSHDGTFAGSRSLLLRLGNGTTLAVLFNSRPYYDWRFINELRKSLENATQLVKVWPSYDCF